MSSNGVPFGRSGGRRPLPFPRPSGSRKYSPPPRRRCRRDRRARPAAPARRPAGPAGARSAARSQPASASARRKRRPAQCAGPATRRRNRRTGRLGNAHGVFLLIFVAQASSNFTIREQQSCRVKRSQTALKAKRVRCPTPSSSPRRASPKAQSLPLALERVAGSESRGVGVREITEEIRLRADKTRESPLIEASSHKPASSGRRRKSRGPCHSFRRKSGCARHRPGRVICSASCCAWRS